MDSELAIDPLCCLYVASDSLDGKIELKRNMESISILLSSW